MKTSVEIADTLLKEARRTAEREGTTLRALIEAGLRRTLDERKRVRSLRVRLVTFRGDGLHPDAADRSWGRIRDPRDRRGA